jgi:CRP-like cAMP-binding protein
MRFQESKELAVLRSFPGDMRTSIRNYYNTYRLKFDQLCETYETLKELPTNVRSEMSLFVNSGLIQKVNFFQFAEPDFILRLSKSLTPELALEDSFVVQRGEVATKMYFIKSGIVQVLATDNKTIIAFMSEGTYFGEIGILLT